MIAPHEPDPLDRLGEVQRVEAPPFLYTRILARIGQQRAARLHPAWTWATAGMLLVLMGANIWTLRVARQAPQQAAGVQTVATAMHLYPHNQLYE
ncbi:MAG: hypothetical protein OHK0039_48070 [Bacteroidia bacterium]